MKIKVIIGNDLVDLLEVNVGVPVRGGQRWDKTRTTVSDEVCDVVT